MPEQPGAHPDKGPITKKGIYIPVDAVRQAIDTSSLIGAQKDILNRSLEGQIERHGEDRPSFDKLLTEIEETVGIDSNPTIKSSPAIQPELTPQAGLRLVRSNEAPPAEPKSTIEERVNIIKDEISKMADTSLVVRSVLEGLLGVRFSQLSREEQRKIEEELRINGVDNLDTNKI